MLLFSYDTGDTESARDELRTRENVRFVDRAEFFTLLLSNKALDRCDFPSADVRGIYDPILEFRYLIEEERLFPAVT